MIERRGGEASLREALLRRSDLPPEVRYTIGLAVAEALSHFVTDRGWLAPSAATGCAARPASAWLWRYATNPAPPRSPAWWRICARPIS